jgi:hypothetical protein
MLEKFKNQKLNIREPLKNYWQLKMLQLLWEFSIKRPIKMKNSIKNKKKRKT